MCQLYAGHPERHRIIATGEQCSDPAAIESKHSWMPGMVKWIEFDESDLEDEDEGPKARKAER